MNKKIILSAILSAAIMLPSIAVEPKKLLLVTVTTGFRHSSIPTAEKVITKLARESGAFTVDLVQQPPNKPNPPKKPQNPTPEDEAKYKEDLEKYKAEDAKWQAEVKKVLEKLSPDNLKKYDGVIFANTTGDLPLPDRQAFIDWIKEGHAFIGMHSASDTFHGFKAYIEMLGGEFKSHGAQASVECINEDPQHCSCKHLSQQWPVFDEIYIMKNFNRDTVHTLLGLDKEPNNKTPGYYPVSWCKEFGKGKVFYTSLGHREDIWDDETPANFKRQNSPDVSRAYQKHILGGIKWAVGLEPGDAKPQIAK
ncbi:MAG TPA: ThuA domain-containing protein [Verrucomicrobiota bacterium]|nr:ThuA domain-containing protein [Verrucomicrobiota bacterium]